MSKLADIEIISKGLVIYDLQLALNIATNKLKDDIKLMHVFPRVYDHDTNIAVTGELNWDTYKLLVHVLIDMIPTLHELPDWGRENALFNDLCIMRDEWVNTIKNEKDEGKNIKLTRKFIFDILRQAYGNLNFGSVRFEATGFPDYVVFYSGRGEIKVTKKMDSSGDGGFYDMWLSGVTNIIEIHNTIRLFPTRAEYNAFLAKPISYLPCPDVQNVLPAKKLVTVPLNTIVENYGAVTGTGKSTRVRPTKKNKKGKVEIDMKSTLTEGFLFKNLGVPFWEMSVLGREYKKVREGAIHKLCIKPAKAAYKTFFTHYLSLVPQNVNVTEFIKTYLPGMYYQEGWPRNVKENGCSVNSFHIWCLAVDFDAARNAMIWAGPYSRLAQPIYRPFLDILEHYGFLSLGRHENWDWMHFQFALWNGDKKNQSNAADIEK